MLASVVKGMGEKKGSGHADASLFPPKTELGVVAASA